ncbi:MAG: DUF2585 domain-containing protein [Candidatus Hydrogenedentes bacterium]|nr:DUF2585 domain-containing protein [Candidatus Hydrogenedentota bacterium]
MKFENRTVPVALSAAAALLLLQATVLYLFGQPPICTCGYVKAWEGVVKSSGNSQHLTDWYTFSHIIHGLAFYGLLTWAFPKMPVAWRFAGAVGLEAGWEILENTPMVINHYRKQALAQGYVGDSIINSVCDNLSMIAGFAFAWRARVWMTVGLVAAFELFTLACIRDNLTLNIINLIHPIDAIGRWQAGG